MGKRGCLDCGIESRSHHNNAKRCFSCSNKYRVGMNHHSWGKKLSEKHKKKISNSLKGRTIPEAQTLKLALFNKGRRKSIDARIRMSLGKTKEKIFTGFKEEFNKRIRHLAEFLKWRKSILERDNYHCQNCGKTNCYLEVHHIIPYSKIIRIFNIKTLEEATKCDLLWDLRNGITYCRECHIKLDSNIRKRMVVVNVR